MVIINDQQSLSSQTDVVHPPNKPFITSEQIKRMETNKLNAKRILLERQRLYRRRKDDKSQISKGKNNKAFSNISKNCIKYDLSKIKDYKGGYIVDKDPLDQSEKSGFNQDIKQDIIFEPAISLDHSKNIKCKECGSVELDFQFLEIFNVNVCYKCKKALPDKYSLLTKTECKDDYLLTNSELDDQEILPHMRKCNPRKPEWSTMMLFLRYQVEEFAWKKWGGPEELDKEWQRRLKEKELKRDKKLEKKIQELKKHTRTTQYIERIKGKQTKHIHHFSIPITDSSTGSTVKKCSCGFETEEILI